MSLASTCKVALCIPADRRELDEYVAEPRGRDFLSSQAITVRQYEREIIGPVTRARELWQRLGVEVYSGVTLTTLPILFAEPEPAMVAIVSHWQTGDPPKIEFFDGMAAIDEVAEQIPADFGGIIDLNVCQSLDLALAIRRKAPDSHPKWSNQPTIPAFWFSVYSEAFKLMAETNASYMDALELTIESFKHA